MRKPEAGFTLVELLLAMAVFSFMLVIVTSGYIQLMRIYQSGLASRATQQNARGVVDNIEQVMRTAGKGWTNTGNTTLCLQTGTGVTEYSVKYSTSTPVQHDLYRKDGLDVDPNCPSVLDVAGWTKLNSNDVDARLFQTETTDSVAGSFGTVVVTIGMASRDLLANVVVTPNADITKSILTCSPGVGAQFCATTTLTTAGVLRGNSL